MRALEDFKVFGKPAAEAKPFTIGGNKRHAILRSNNAVPNATLDFLGSIIAELINTR